MSVNFNDGAAPAPPVVHATPAPVFDYVARAPAVPHAILCGFGSCCRLSSLLLRDVNLQHLLVFSTLKMDSDPVLDSHPGPQSREFAALAGVSDAQDH